MEQCAKCNKILMMCGLPSGASMQFIQPIWCRFLLLLTNMLMLQHQGIGFV
jgi:hypothetical protein